MRDDELELTLRGIGRALAYPQPMRTGDAVRARLRARPERARWWRHYGLAPALVTAVLLLVVLTLALPDARAAARDFLHLRGIDIFPVPSVPSLTPRPSPTGSASPAGVVPGERVTLVEAQQRVHFTIRVPSALGAPDQVYVDTTQQAGEHVALVYLPRPGIPASPATGISVLVVEFQGAVEATFFGKGFGPGTSVEPVTVDGTTGYWIAGEPHFFFYRTANGTILQESVRLAGNTLVWTSGEVTLRVEANVSKTEAVAIASSLR